MWPFKDDPIPELIANRPCACGSTEFSVLYMSKPHFDLCACTSCGLTYVIKSVFFPDAEIPSNPIAKHVWSKK